MANTLSDTHLRLLDQLAKVGIFTLYFKGFQHDNGTTFGESNLFSGQTLLNATQWNVVKHLFSEALELKPQDAERLLQASEAPPEVVEEVRRLLSAHHDPETFLSRPLVRPTMYKRGAEFQAPPTVEPGQTIGLWKCLDLLGRGALATVILAEKTGSLTISALKCSRFEGANEARLLAQLDHPNIVKVHSLNVVDGIELMSMQPIPGPSLGELLDWLRANPSVSADSLVQFFRKFAENVFYYSPDEFDRRSMQIIETHEPIVYFSMIFADLFNALAFAHHNGVIHGDVKPGNVLFSPYGRPYLTDFNVSSGRIQDTDLDIRGGTPKYMSPEQKQLFEGGTRGNLDHRSDLYSMGVILGELLDQFQAESKTQLVQVLRTIEQECRESNPDLRPDSGSLVAARLTSLVQGYLICKVAQEETGQAVPLRTKDLVRATIVPHLVGSAVNIAYNWFWIENLLNNTEQSLFRSLLAPYNLIAYPLGVLLAWPGIRMIQMQLAQPIWTPSDFDKLTGFGRHLFWGATVGWLPGAIVFPVFMELALESKELPALHPEVYVRFALSFSTAWLIATTYSLASVAKLIFRQLGSRPLPDLVNLPWWLTGYTDKFSWLRLSAGLIPLIAAILVVVESTHFQNMSGREFRFEGFRAMIILLLGLGMAGYLWVNRTLDQSRRLCNLADLAKNSLG